MHERIKATHQHAVYEHNRAQTTTMMIDRFLGGVCHTVIKNETVGRDRNAVIRNYTHQKLSISSPVTRRNSLKKWIHSLHTNVKSFYSNPTG